MSAVDGARAKTTLNEIVRDAALAWPDKIALDFSGEEFTFAELDRRSTRLAHGLRSLGVGPGDRVCSMLDNNPDQVFTWFAIVKLGAISVPLNTALRGEFLRHQIADAGSKIVVFEDHYRDQLEAIAADLPELSAVALRGKEPALPLGPSVATHRLDQLFLANESELGVEVRPSDLAMILYTSGTTGPSKGCMICHNHVCNTGFKMATGSDLGHEDTFWTPLPLFHMGAAGFLVGCIQLGAKASIYRQFSVSNFWPEIERSGADIALIISVMLTLVAEAPDNEASQRNFGRLRGVVGVPFPGALQEKWKSRFGVKLAGAMGYGMTEATPLTFTPITESAPDGASGRRYEDFDVQVVDEEDRILPAGEVGQLVVRPRRADIMFKGYWQRPEATLEALSNLWFHTGDLGRFDGNDFFYFVDRKKDYLRRGGENISSFEMEMAFRKHAAVEDVAAHAVPSDKGEDEVKICAILREGAVVSEEELCRWSVDQLPHYAVPRYIEFCAELPRNASGRVLKYELRQRGITATTWDRATSTIELRKRPATNTTRETIDG